MKRGGLWMEVGAFMLVSLLGLGSAELVQRRRFTIMKTEVETLVAEFQTLRLAREGNVQCVSASTEGTQPLIVTREAAETWTSRNAVWTICIYVDTPYNRLRHVLAITLTQERDGFLGVPTLYLTHSQHPATDVPQTMSDRLSAQRLEHTLVLTGRVGG